VVATGLDRIPWTPDWPGRSGFTRPVRHVAELARPADLHGQRVLLVGAGNSGVDIAGHLVDAGVADLWVSVRTPPNVLPDEIHRVPLQLVALTGGRLPERARDWLAKSFNRYAFGDLAPYGLPRPVDGPYRHLRQTGVTVAIDRGFVAALKRGRLRVVAEIDRLDGADVMLRDGTRLTADIVLAATGYRTGLEKVVGHLGVLDEHGRPRIRPGDPSSPPGLHFVGFWPAIDGNLRLHPPEARRIAGLIAR
jgi:cation diffusion facilitator CzcD-associated flavoprotein CzcO